MALRTRPEHLCEGQGSALGGPPVLLAPLAICAPSALPTPPLLRNAGHWLKMRLATEGLRRANPGLRFASAGVFLDDLTLLP